MEWVNVSDRYIDFGYASQYIDPITAALSAVENIVQRYPPPYHLMVSGGIDSQFMLYVWKRSGHTFNAVSFVYNNKLNQHDLIELSTFSVRQGINIHYVDFDVLKFLENDYHTMALDSKCSSPQIVTHMAFTRGLSGTCIFSGNFLSSTAPPLPAAMIGLYRFSKTSKNTVIPYFFLHTKDLAYSMIPYEDIVDAKMLPYHRKICYYRLAGVPIVPQPEKQTGFEKIKDLYDEKYKITLTAKDRLKLSGKPSTRSFDILLRYPYEELFSNSQMSYNINGRIL